MSVYIYICDILYDNNIYIYNCTQESEKNDERKSNKLQTVAPMSHHRSLGDGGAARAVPQTSGVRGCYRKGVDPDPTDPTVPTVVDPAW